jgi:hypothetical protein
VLGTASVGTSLHDAYTSVGKNLTTTYAQKKRPVVVGCVTRSHEQRTEQVCAYDDGKRIPVYTATYRLTVYESSTRKVLRSIGVPTTSDYVCQGFTAYDGKSFYRTWDSATVALALQPFTE